MKIAIVSEDGLPDARVERIVKSLSKIYDEIYFIGLFKGFTLWDNPSKLVVKNINWGRFENLVIEPYYYWLKRKISRELAGIKPDILIAVNLVAGKILDELKYSFVLDYHEIWSLLLKYVSPRGVVRKLTYLRRRTLYPRLEELLLTKHPYITVSSRAREYFIDKYGNSNSIVVENYPSIDEVKHVSNIEAKGNNVVKSFCYVGKDLVFFDGHLSRDLRKTLNVLDDLWNRGFRFRVELIGSRDKIREYIEPRGWMKLIDIYGTICNVDFGIMSYNPIHIQKYFSMNRFYTYVHSGVIPIATDTFEQYVSKLKNYLITVESSNYEKSLMDKYVEAIAMDSEEIWRRKTKLIEYARVNYVWENQENELLNFIKKYG
ncbi:MAG: hypothetical protein QW170_05070 [Desulfurococcaceae archaeon]